MPLCPVCGENVDADETAFTHHVNLHLDNGVVESAPKSLGGDSEEVESCPICDFPLHGVAQLEKEQHIHTCLGESSTASAAPAATPVKGFIPIDSVSMNSENTDVDFDYSPENMRRNGQAEEDDWVEVGWSGPAKPGGWHDWVHRKAEKGDNW